MTKIVHIGLMKCGTTYLQNNIFPKIAEIKKMKYWREDKVISNKIYNHYLSMLFENDYKFIDIPNNIFISFEKLVGYIDPYYWDDYATKNLKAFGKNTHIILTIRKPKDFLSSVYIESCLHSGITISPEYFFLEKKIWSSQIIMKKFSIEHFNYTNLISCYKKKFKKVSVIKFEDLFKIEIIKKVFNLNEFEIKLFAKYYSNNELKNKKYLNKSFSNRSVKIMIFVNKLFSLIGLQLHTSLFRINEINQVRNPIKNKFIPKKLSFFNKMLIKISRFFWFNTLARRFIDKFFYDKKYTLDFKKLKYINIKSLEIEYKNIKTSF